MRGVAKFRQQALINPKDKNAQRYRTHDFFQTREAAKICDKYLTARLPYIKVRSLWNYIGTF
jgi:hypothetical protein